MNVCVPSQGLFLIHKAKLSCHRIPPDPLTKCCELARQFGLAASCIARAWVGCILYCQSLGFPLSMGFCAVCCLAPPHVCICPSWPPSDPFSHKLMSDPLPLGSTSPRCCWDPRSLWEPAKSVGSSSHLYAFSHDTPELGSRPCSAVQCS